jgi:hypothetical protein
MWSIWSLLAAVAVVTLLAVAVEQAGCLQDFQVLLLTVNCG